MKQPWQQQPKGQVLVLAALMIVVLFALASLALDLGRAYGVRARLNAAVDAASFEAAKALGRGAKKDDAAKVATAYFQANYPADYLGATPDTPTVDAKRDEFGVWTVNVTATAQMPTLLAGMIQGGNSMTIGSASESERKSLDMVLVIDTSHSLSAVFDTDPGVKAGARAYLNFFSDQDDRLALVAFSRGAYPTVSICGTYPNPIQNPDASSVLCNRGFNKADLTAGINSLTCPLDGTTASEEGLKKALDQLNSLDPMKQGRKRVIVFFSDGSPNTFNAVFPVSGEGNLYSGWDNDPGSHMLFDPSMVFDPSPASYVGKALPRTDKSGTIPLASYNNIRPLPLLPHTFDAPAFSCAANKAARNMAENVAHLARTQNITVYTLGLNIPPTLLDDPEFTSTDCSTHYERGSTILKRLANTIDSDTYNPSEPTGIYCQANSTDDLKPCFDRIASAILRITK